MPPRPPTPNRDPSTGSSGRDDSPSLLPGEVLGGKYRIEARLAEGGMGVVMRATHLDLDCQVAIKLLRPELSANEDVVARLLGEARIAASLRSKHVNRVLDVGRTPGGVPYLVLEYLEGSDLGGYLERRGALPVSEAVDYVLQACEALAEAHAIGIVHRDMKPENLFLAEEADGGFVLKVLDFGISKAPARRGGRTLTDPFEVVGSPTYMSPEQVRGAGVDARTDVWALGAVLYELCTGDIFFDEESLTATFKRVLDPRDLPPPLEGGEDAGRVHDIIVRCLEREPERRFQDMVELARALGPFGTDAAQPARVAKVAAAARARFIATTNPNAAPSVGTPLSLSTSRVDGAVPGERPLAPERRWRAWSFASAAAVVLVAAGVGGARQWSPPDVSEGAFVPPVATITPQSVSQPPAFHEPTPTPPKVAATASEAPAPAPRPTFSAAPHAHALARLALAEPAAVPAAPTVAPSPEPAEPLAEAGPEAPSPLPEPTAHGVDAEPVSSAEPAPTHAFFDAWDTKTFGGRK